MDTREVSLKGVKFRKKTPYFEARIPGQANSVRFYCTKIKSLDEGGLCYDIVQRYIERGVIGQKRKVPAKLNYPEYSRTLPLEPLRSNFDIRNLSHKEEAMEIILKQAQAAAKNLPENLRRSTPIVGCPSPSNRSSSHQNVHSEPLVAKQDSPGVCTNQFPGTLEVTEQGFKSEGSECLELRKLSEDHNLKFIDEFLMKDDSDLLGRQRANEDDRIPPLPEDFPSKEDSEYGVFILDSDGYGPPGNPRVGARLFVTDITTPPAVIGVSQCVVPLDFRSPLVAKQDMLGLCANQLNLQEISELSHHCKMSHTFEVTEREMLERMVAGINKDSGIISLPEPCRDDFTDSMALLKQLMATGETIPGTLEVAEQGFKSEGSECLKLRKLLEDHNLKFIDEFLMKDDSDSLGR